MALGWRQQRTIAFPNGALGVARSVQSVASLNVAEAALGRSSILVPYVAPRASHVPGGLWLPVKPEALRQPAGFASPPPLCRLDKVRFLLMLAFALRNM